MITVSHRGVPENGYSVRQILGYYIKNIISIDLANKNRLPEGTSLSSPIGNTFDC